MTTIGGITIPINQQPPPPPPPPPETDDGTGDGTGTGDTGGTGETGGSTGGTGTGGTGNTGGSDTGGSGGSDTGDTSGSGTGDTGGGTTTDGTGGSNSGTTSGDGSGGGSTSTTGPSSSGKRAPAYTLDFSKPDKAGTTEFTVDGVISESQRLDLAFARVLDAAMARRYAEAARLELISDGLLERLRSRSDSGSAFTRDVATLRESEASRDERNFDRTA